VVGVVVAGGVAEGLEVSGVVVVVLLVVPDGVVVVVVEDDGALELMAEPFDGVAVVLALSPPEQAASTSAPAAAAENK